jgi:hypothetical protein
LTILCNTEYYCGATLKLKEKGMKKKEGENNKDYLSKVFSALPPKKRDNILKQARTLLEVQDKGISTYPVKKR